MALGTFVSAPTPARGIRSCLLLSLLPLVTGCASVSLQEAGSLSSYERLQQPADSKLSSRKSRVHVEKDAALAARSVRIIPTAYSRSAISAKLSTLDRRLVANAVDRAVCIGLSDRFHIALPPQPADLTVHVTIATIVPTDEVAAATTKVLDIGQTVLTGAGVLETSVPIPTVRVPIGLGGIALEAEAIDAGGRQIAAMLWAKGARSLLGNTTRVSSVGDAYELASSFGDDFSELLVTGEDPFRFKLPGLPYMHRLRSNFGGPPKEKACDAFGRRRVADIVAGGFGFPPEWTDAAGQEPSRDRLTR
ncbi:MAG: DUF3313 domain-containing protein [Rhodomicrobiaceae bacterium]